MMILELAPRIVVDPDIRFGKPIIKGTRVPVNLVVAKVAGGMSFTALVEEFDLSRDDIRAAVELGRVRIRRPSAQSLGD
jgi:uncharacterized protein (DUF433 family)